MKKFYKNPLIILAVGVLVMAGSTVTATRAAMVYQSAAERINFSTTAISVDIEELVDGDYVSAANGLTFSSVLADNELKIGKKYTEKVRVVNNSSVETGYSEYVRVVVRKSWYKDGKNTELDPSLIKLEVAPGWYLNPDETTAEREVYYMTSPLNCGNAAEFLTSITVDDKVTNFVNTKPAVENGVEIAGTIVNEYQYNGESLYLQIEADALQTHNCEDAIYAAWGIYATCDSQDDGNIIAIGGREIQ